MTESSRLAGLPGYDTAPDVYETPDLIDDTTATTTTIPSSPRRRSARDETADAATTTTTTASEDEDDADAAKEGENGVSKRRLHPERARRVFGAASGRVGVEGVDMSDRVDGGRRGYRVRRPGRRRRGVEGGSEGEEGGSDGEEEGLGERIARLRREVEECRGLAGREKGGDGVGEEGEGAREMEEEVDGLGRLLASIEVPVRRDRRKGQLGGPGPPAVNGDTDIPARDMDEELSDEQTLGRVADFDTRLSALEQALGISSLDAATSDALSAPVLPSLTLLDQQLSALASATSLTHLEAASGRIQKLRGEAEQVSHAQATASPAVNGDVPGPDRSTNALSQEEMDKLQHLYQLLPNLQSLSPTVPAILTRLRSLRTLHTSAANAAAELDEVERRQAQMDEELAQWRDGLARVEKAVGQASEANGVNGRIVDGWVKDLEGRVKGVR
ncbi:hypothetical protein B0A55_04190 [Friedmanniomyces simplex]|uniref:Uncharacterized protein n=1 Tax=Friedmanniomyces simplex TaxID=329884 RepID=A0A4U0XJE6_9PEZI|nr:hypothetical protein B0A55_04190 [Friedmanniomyces simplex]